MVSDKQVQRLRQLCLSGESLSRAAWKSSMDRKTARKYQIGNLPSEHQEHEWRTRDDPFSDVWEMVFEQLAAEPHLQAKVLFKWLQRKQPGRFQDGQLRTFQRGIKRWRATQGPEKEIYFSQVHEPGRLCASDFTAMKALQVTIQGQLFDHMLYHFVLTYSNWEWATICYSESFESLSQGVQEALWKLGAVPGRHRTDRLSAAVNNLSKRREFTARYTGLMNYYKLAFEKTNPNSGHENGDVESLHRHLKDTLNQAFLLRGNRDFDSLAAYQAFVHELMTTNNSGRLDRLQEELPQMHPLPAHRLESYKRVRVRVGSGSLLRVQKNVYSVHSRLVGEMVDVRIHADHLELWYAQQLMERLPRLRGAGKHSINYRHVIDCLVRKPGAFEHYRYREDLFPTSRFRMAYDQLREQHVSSVASRRYLKILELAAKESETGVDDVLRSMLDEGLDFDPQEVQQRLCAAEPVRAATDVTVSEPDLDGFDSLLDDKEVLDECDQGCEEYVEWLSA